MSICAWKPVQHVHASHVFQRTALPRSSARPVVCSSGNSPDSNSNGASSSTSSSGNSDVGLGLKSVWFGAEALGNIIGAMRGGSSSSAAASSASSQQKALSRSEALEQIRQDYAVKYFISGAGDLSAYAPDCRFADPFAGFNGTTRFKNNVSNLGSLLKDVTLEITEWKEESNTLSTKWRFSAILDLPWKPRLAAAGGTLHEFDPTTGLVVQHIESWDVEPGKVVKTLLRPSAKIPTNNWEVLFNSIHDGDLTGIWLASSGNVAKGSGAVLALSVLSKLFTGEGVGAWPLALVALLAALVTEALKISGGMQGGDSGTGGRF